MRTLLVDDEAPARARLRRLLAAHPDVEIVGEAEHGRAALERAAELEPDLVFLDIQMPELGGLEVAAALPEAGAPSVIFATAHDAHAVRAFELAAVDYLLKPIDKDRLAAALDRVRAKKAPASAGTRVLEKMETKSRRMAVRSGNRFVVFDSENIVAVLAQDHYATIFESGREHLLDEPLDRLMQRLDPQRFLRVHRSAIVNVERVDALEQEGDRKYVAVVPGVPKIPVSRDRLDELKTRLGIGL